MVVVDSGDEKRYYFGEFIRERQDETHALLFLRRVECQIKNRHVSIFVFVWNRGILIESIKSNRFRVSKPRRKTSD